MEPVAYSHAVKVVTVKGFNITSRYDSMDRWTPLRQETPYVLQ